MVHNGMCQVREKARKDRSRVLILGVDGRSSCDQVCHDMSVHQWQKIFKIDSENRPRVGEWEIGECKVEKRIKARVSWVFCMQIVNGPF